MISTSQKEHLTYTLILQATMLVGVGILGWTYILPGIEAINANETAAITSIEKYNTIKASGLTYEELTTELTGKGKDALLKEIRSAPADTREIIKKPSDVKSDYTQWLSTAISNSYDDKAKLAQAKQKINSILPTLSPISNSIDEEYITLKEYIRFIETKFLRPCPIGTTSDIKTPCGIKSNIVLGIQGISYPEEFGGNIGTFDLNLDFRATNGNIQKLINYINESGDPELLSFTGILDTKEVPKLLSNPLMTIESLSLADVLSSKIDEENSGRITIRFYVRGSSTEDIKFLQESIGNRKDSLGKDIQKAVEECNKLDFCTNKDALIAFDKKYSEFLRSLDTTSGASSGDIAILGQVATSIRILSDEFSSIVSKK